MIAVLDRFDSALYRVERAAVAAVLSVMGAVVFLDVVYRVTATADSKLVPDALEAAIGAAAMPLWMGLVSAALAVLAFRTRADAAALPRGVAVGVALGALLYGYGKLLPSGLVWSQTLALSLTLWMGMAGACLAAYQRRHLALDVGSKLWPPSVAPKVAAVGHWVTAAFCALVVVLGTRSIIGYEQDGNHIPGHLDTWTQSDHASGNMITPVEIPGLPSINIPKWMVMASIPVGMCILAFRFGLQGLKVWTGAEVQGGDDTLRQLGIEEEAGGAQ